MNRIRIALVAGALLLAGAATAAMAAPSQILTQEEAREAAARQQSGAPAVDLTTCSLNTDTARAFQQALLSVPEQERGRLVASGPCSVPESEPTPSKVDERYRY
jgi:hypothetical protein